MACHEPLSHKTGKWQIAAKKYVGRLGTLRSENRGTLPESSWLSAEKLEKFFVSFNGDFLTNLVLAHKK